MNNFFQYGPPVAGDNFFGRGQLLSKLLLSTDGHVLLIGQRRIGKTSILRQVELLLQTSASQWHNGKPIAILRCNGQSTAGEADAFEVLVADAIDQLAEWAEQSASGFAIPKREQDGTLKYRVAERVFKSALNHGLKLLLLIDEIDALPQTSRVKLRALTQESGLPLFAVSSTNPAVLGTADAGSAWFNFFSVEPVGLFSYAEAGEMLQTISRQSGKEFTEQECSVLIEVFGPFPFFLQMAGRECFSSSDFLGSADRRGVAFKRALSNMSFHLQPHFTGMLERLDEKQHRSLIEVAQKGFASNAGKVNELAAMALVMKDNAAQWKPFASSSSPPAFSITY